MTMLDTALSWLSRGVVPIPLRARTKRPQFPWARLQRYRPPPAVVRRWNWSEANLGLLCGEVSGNLVVLDFDTTVAYVKWRAVRPRLSQTYTVRTSRGRHVYLRVRDIPPRTLGMEGGDVKATGYVVAAPSIHPDGTLYRPDDPDAPLLSIDSLEAAGIRVLFKSEPPPVDLPVERPTERGYGLVDEVKRLMPITQYLGRWTKMYPTSPDGVWLMCHCPIHDDHNPSMWVNVRWGICRCFKPSCRGSVRAMDVINLHARLRGVSNEYALQELAAELGL